MTVYLGTDLIAGVTTTVDKSERIGQIIQSTIPLTDAGVHLLDGSLIQGGGIYDDFVTYISNLDTSADYFCTEADWQTSVTTYGVCGKFVYDSVNNTVRLPKITGFTEGTITPTTLGDLVEAGLPNITGVVDFGYGNDGSDPYNADGAFYLTDLTTRFGRSPDSNDGYGRVNFDASHSNSIYGNSTTVQPQSIKVLYYIVIATTTKTEIEVDIDEIATDLNGKVDKADCATIYPVISTYVNGTSWYRIYSDGWCEQGGEIGTGTTTVAFLKTFASIPLCWTMCDIATNQNASGATATTTGLTFSSYSVASRKWQACGYLAEGEY